MSEPDPQLSPSRPSSASMIQLSPLHTSPPSSLLYCCITALHHDEGNILSLAVLRGIAFTGSESRRIRIWWPPEFVKRGYLKVKSGDVRALLAYGNKLFTTHKDCKSWSSFSLFSRTSLHQHKDCISCLAYYQAEGLLYKGSWDRTVKAWRVSDKKCVDSFVAHEDNVNGIVVNQEDGCVFTCSSDGSVKIWRRVYGESSHTLTMFLKFQPSPVNALALSWSTSSCFLYSGSSDGFINLWEKEIGSGRFNHGGFLQGHRFGILCLVTVEMLVFSGSEDTTIRVWRREKGSCFHAYLAVLDGHTRPVRFLAACLEMEKVVMGLLVYSVSLDQTFRVWRVKVFPGEMKVTVEEDQRINQKSKIDLMEYEISPVLSPSWVERKLQGNPLH
ncbi:hypothetical protein NE237_025629 [Protea cynaroides]|uniref:Uncharacterized protein n=1 Tax=Protea cynaroides TaxID=273540 RepID=A0A9Q0K1Y4_9MAGN|nr:hypothetical protein NE237_025629 [Protea cynaroides]